MTRKKKSLVESIAHQLLPCYVAPTIMRLRCVPCFQSEISTRVPPTHASNHSHTCKEITAPFVAN